MRKDLGWLAMAKRRWDVGFFRVWRFVVWRGRKDRERTSPSRLTLELRSLQTSRDEGFLRGWRRDGKKGERLFWWWTLLVFRLTVSRSLFSSLLLPPWPVSI